MLKHELISLIEKKRAELISVVSKNGLSSTAAVRHSQELDELINKYNNIYIKRVHTS